MISPSRPTSSLALDRRVRHVGGGRDPQLAGLERVEAVRGRPLRSRRSRRPAAAAPATARTMIRLILSLLSRLIYQPLTSRYIVVAVLSTTDTPMSSSSARERSAPRAAYELARRGARVTVLERSATPGGCSYGNAGLICPSHAEALANPAAIRDGLRWMGRRDSPFRLRPRLALVPWLARFGAAALPARSAAATARLRALAERSLALHAALAGPRHLVRPPRDPQRLRARRRAGHAQRGRRRASSSPPSRPASPAPSSIPTRRTATRARSSTRCSTARASTAPRSAPASRSCACGAPTAAIAGLDTTDGPLDAGTVVLAAGTWTRELAPRSACTCRSSRPRATTSRSTPPALQAGIPIYMEEARVIATPLGGRLRLAGTLELAGHGRARRPRPARVAAARRAPDARAAAATAIVAGLARAAAVRARRAADHRARRRRREPRSGHRACDARHHARAGDRRDRGRPGRRRAAAARRRAVRARALPATARRDRT